MTAAAPIQVGIFTNDLCIGFRIVMHELLDTHVFRVFDAAKEIHQKRSQDNFRIMYERGMKTVNAWDMQMKERYRAQVIGQYRQLTDLYHHIYLMYVQEMYDQSLDDVTVRVNIPALATMLHMFLKLACNHHVILSGEYVTTMNFAGRVLFVETIIRRLLYELLVQQNNIKSISTAVAKRPSLHAGNTGVPAKPMMSVHSEEEVFSADMMVGTPRQAATPRRLSPTKDAADSDRFWMAPTPAPPVFVPKQQQQQSSTASSNNSLLAVLGPGYTNGNFTNSNLSPKLSDLIPPLGTVSPTRSSPNTSEAPKVVVVNSPVHSPAASSVSISAVVPPSPADTVLTSPQPAPEQQSSITSPAAELELVPKTTPKITSLPNPPVISETQISLEKPIPPAAPLFELKSQFTPFKPGGTLLPDANVSTVNRKDIDVDSLQLQPSDQDFAEEARLLLQTDTLTPFDSVTNIANGDRRPPLFFEPVRAL